jgi:hypothetical protein
MRPQLNSGTLGGLNMGTWGPGIFQSDAALDTVSSVLDGTTRAISAFLESDPPDVEDLDIVIAAVAIHIALHDHCHARPPDEHVLTVILKDKVLRTYDEQIDGLAPTQDFKRQRRAEIEAILDRYEQIARAAPPPRTFRQS